MLNVPSPSFPAPRSQQRVATVGRSKVPLKPGRSLMDWIRVTKSGKDLTGLKGRLIEVTEEELAKHNKKEDCWMCIRGMVYNITPYMEYHPGGEDELMKAAGADGTDLFDQVHRWVNYESMLKECLIGRMAVKHLSVSKGGTNSENKGNKAENGMLAPSNPSQISTKEPHAKYDWYQTDFEVTIVVYTKQKNLGSDVVIVDHQEDILRGEIIVGDYSYLLLIELSHKIQNDIDEFVGAFYRVFDILGHQVSASKHLMTIRQGAYTVAEYAIKFRTLAAEVNWNNEALVAAFSQGLCNMIKDEIAARDLPRDLDELISFTILIDTRLRKRPSFKECLRRLPSRLAPSFTHPPMPPSPPTPPESDSSGSEPMQLGDTRLTGEERAFQRKEGLCLYCGKPGHLLRSCPVVSLSPRKWRFIKDFSSVVKPLTDMTCKGADASNWSPGVLLAFEKLKTAFSMAPILRHANPALPFTLEVDASKTGVGALLSQRSTPGEALLPCGYFSKKLSKAKQIDDIGDRELLAIILALKEWHYLLEGTKAQILILTDHKIVTCLSEAKCLSARQARWELFLSRFHFVMSYLPGSKNIRADALSCQYCSDSRKESPPSPIIPADLRITEKSGKVELILQKKDHIVWNTLGRPLEEHTSFVKRSHRGLYYRKCRLASKKDVNHNTKLFCFELPRGCHLQVPVGHHVYLKLNISGVEVVKPYTPVSYALSLDPQEPGNSNEKSIYIMIKIYPSGSFTPKIDSLSEGDYIYISNPQGDFKMYQTEAVEDVFLVAAGTGLTPMVKLLQHILNDLCSLRKAKLIFFNKTYEDILWREQIEQLCLADKRFETQFVLSEPSDNWIGDKGQISYPLLSESITRSEERSKVLICICGPNGFVDEGIRFLQDLGFSEDEIFVFRE
ncbi:cytochrome b5 reductase 4 [Rhinophrynus dorsalis]